MVETFVEIFDTVIGSVIMVCCLVLVGFAICLFYCD